MEVIFLIVALALGTFLFRFVPLATLSRAELPKELREWLRLLPGAVLAALLAQALLAKGGALALAFDNPAVLATIPSALVAWRVGNMLATMAAGMATYALTLRLS